MARHWGYLTHRIGYRLFGMFAVAVVATVAKTAGFPLTGSLPEFVVVTLVLGVVSLALITTARRLIRR